MLVLLEPSLVSLDDILSDGDFVFEAAALFFEFFILHFYVPIISKEECFV